MSNAIRYADASTIRVDVLAASDEVRVTILDDGTFRPPPDGHRGLGIEGMRSRATELGGTFALEPGDDHGGTRVTVALPRHPARD